MSVFEPHSQVITDYRDFVRSFITIADERARDFVDHSLDHEVRFWPDPLLQVSPSYARSATVDELAARGILLAETSQVFRDSQGHPFHLYQHHARGHEAESTSDHVDQLRDGRAHARSPGGSTLSRPGWRWSAVPRIGRASHIHTGGGRVLMWPC
jgi:hypothetical protein